MTGRLAIDDVSPVVDCGAHPAKAVVGEHLPIEASVWREGHEPVAATVVWCGPNDAEPRRTRMADTGDGLDRFAATIVPDSQGAWYFRIEAWGDPWTGWRHAVEVKAGAGQTAAELTNDLEEGARLLDSVAARPARTADRPHLEAAAAALRDSDRVLEERLAPALSTHVGRLMYDHPARELVTPGQCYQLFVDRPRARYGAWYEFFPRSTGGLDARGRPVHGTLATAAKELGRVAAMGFDVAYLPPIHPIGETNRKGANNTLRPTPDEPGSPWAIGSRHGGHDAVAPELGTIDDFDEFVATASSLGLEVALDLALQCAPDHPWVAEHPEWFTTRPDGTIGYAENPPKRYQDIYPLNFDNDPAGIYAEAHRVVEFWIAHDVRIFRVDNPHTKPPDFWEWLIWTVKQTHPDVLFLAEAFTRPARLYGLAKLGFTQSYTYFTWRTGKDELTDFGVELVTHAAEMRPNLFVNTPDILHASLQQGGPAAFALRAVLAATLSPSWGVYSGYELYEDRALAEGSEEYLNSEKYQLRSREFAAALAEGRSLEPFIRLLNAIRAEHPALAELRTLRFHYVEHPSVIAYSKTDPAGEDIVLTVVNLDPHHVAETTLWIDLPALGFAWTDRLRAHDLVTGAVFDWGQADYIRLEPWNNVAHIVHLQRGKP